MDSQKSSLVTDFSGPNIFLKHLKVEECCKLSAPSFDCTCSSTSYYSALSSVFSSEESFVFLFSDVILCKLELYTPERAIRKWCHVLFTLHFPKLLVGLCRLASPVEFGQCELQEIAYWIDCWQSGSHTCWILGHFSCWERCLFHLQDFHTKPFVLSICWSWKHTS